MTNLVRYGLALLLTLTVLGSPAVTSSGHAQTTAADTAVALDQETLLQKQMTVLLRSGEAQREGALQLIGHYAFVDRYDAAFFRPLIDPILALATNGDTEAHQLMAVSALHSIGTPAAMDRLAARLSDIRSDRVRSMAEQALAHYMLERADENSAPLTDRLPTQQ